LYIPLVAPGPINCLAPETAAVEVGVKEVGDKKTFKLSQSEVVVPSPPTFHLKVKVTLFSPAGIVTSL
jgi:hypothetical protein